MPTQSTASGRRWSPSAAAARIAGGRAARDVVSALPDATAIELNAARKAVRDGVTEMPDLLRAGFVVALFVTLVVPLRRLLGLQEVERFGRGLALAAVFDSRAGDDR
jgi:hypothetical protein